MSELLSSNDGLEHDEACRLAGEDLRGLLDYARRDDAGRCREAAGNEVFRHIVQHETFQLGAADMGVAGCHGLAFLAHLVATGSEIESTARQAYELGFNVTLAVDAMTDPRPNAHDHSVRSVFPRLGESGSTDAVIALLNGRG